MKPKTQHIIWTRPHSPADAELFGSYLSQVIFLPTLNKISHLSQIQHLFQSLQKKDSPPPILMLTSPYSIKLLLEHHTYLLPHLPQPTPPPAPLITLRSSSLSSLIKKGWHEYPLNKSRTLNFSSGQELAQALIHHLASTQENRDIWFVGASEPAWDYSRIFAAHSLPFKHFKIYSSQAKKPEDLKAHKVKKIRSLHSSQLITTFTSPASFRAYQKLSLPLGDHPLALGATTARALRALHIQALQSPTPTLKALADLSISILQKNHSP